MVPRYSRARRLTTLLLCLVWIAIAAGQTTPLTVEEIYGQQGWTRFNGSASATMTWAPDGNPWLGDTHYLWPVEGQEDSSSNARGPWLRVDAASGASEPLFAYERLESALLEAGAAPADARAASRRRPAVFDARRAGFLVTIGADLYSYDIPSARARRLTASPDAKTEPVFSPDGRHVAFIKNGNLMVSSLDSIGERALTTDGSNELSNGRLDWVYSEELYGRGNHRGYWWSPDSASIAFLQLDNTRVPEYTLIDDIPYHPAIQRWHYPKAGDPNPVARLGVVDLRDGRVQWIDTSKYSDFLIVAVDWSPDSRDVVYQIQNRQQTFLDLNRADRATGAARTLIREDGGPWVERWQDASVNPAWLADGSFLWPSERSGWRHVYHYSATGQLIRQLTDGEWEVRALHGVDPVGQWIYFSSTASSPIGLDVYRVRLNGSGLQRVSAAAGRHRAFFNPSRTLFLDSWSDITTPPQVRLHRPDAPGPVRLVDANPVPASKEHARAKPELMQVKTRDGFVMEAMMIKPPDFDPSKRYPVYQFTYGGPHAQQVVNAWGGLDFIYHQLLAERGIIVWICDNRSASGKGMRSAWPVHKNLGALELRDIEDGLAWLKAQPYVDGSRIGIAGISYGAFMTLYALTHSRSFAMGIAEGAVSDWRSYDTIYTERYMGLPAENPDGYRRSSPRFEAANLSGSLLLVHSALDDNVHPQNASQFAYALQQAGKPFQMMIYPRSAHGIFMPHLRRMMLDFTTQNLLR